MLSLETMNPDQAMDTFMAKKMYFSYSSMNLLLYSPAAFYAKYILRVEEKESLAKHLVQGKVIHALLLEQEKFKENFLVSPDNLPTGNNRLLVDAMYVRCGHIALSTLDPRTMLKDFRKDLLEVMEELGIHQNLVDEKATKNKTDVKTGDEKRLEKACIADNENYWDYLLKRGSASKTIIDEKTYQYCLGAVEIIRLSPEILNLLGVNRSPLDNVEVYNESFLQAGLANFSWGIKGFVDNYKIDHDKRVIYVNDLKTTAKSLADFSESIEFYRYWLQAVVYLMLIHAKYEHLIDQGYDVRFHFVVIDANHLPYAFPVTPKTLAKWVNDTQEIFKKVDYHYSNGRYDLPYEFDLGLIKL